MQFPEFDEFTRKLCAETEKKILSIYENPEMAIEQKEDQTPVTLADRETERTIRESIEILYPEHGIIGEEYGETKPDAEYKWVVDPIDGTKTFTTACPLFGTMIALLRQDEPIFGCINYPAIGKRIASDGHTTFLNGQVVRGRQGVPLEEATLLTTDFLAVGEHQDGPRFEALARKTKLCRTWGDCFGYYLVAIGKADIMLDPILSKWDLMALIPILRGAGVTVTDWRGGNPAQGESLIAANADLHDQILRMLND